MPKKVIILGASGHAKVIADIILKSQDKVVGFLDDNIDLLNQEIFNGLKVLGAINDQNINTYTKNCYFIIGIGDNHTRKTLAEKYNHLKWYTAIHPNAVIANGVQISKGTVIMAGSVINPDTYIGEHCIINTCSSIDHDNVLGNYVHISPGAHLSGSVRVDDGTWICAGSTVINNLHIAANNIIGAGAVVVKSIEDSGHTYVGIPSKKIK